MRSLPKRFTLRSRCYPLRLFIFFLAVIPVATVHAEQWKKLKPQGYVNDFAGVLNPTTVEKLTEVSTEVDQKTKAQIAVVIIKTLEDDTAEDFANHLFQKWGVGYKGTDRGVMVLLAADDHKYRTEVGYGLEPILPDGKVGEFGRSMVPLLRQGDYNGATLLMVSQIAEVIAQDSPSSRTIRLSNPIRTSWPCRTNWLEPKTASLSNAAGITRPSRITTPTSAVSNNILPGGQDSSGITTTLLLPKLRARLPRWISARLSSDPGSRERQARVEKVLGEGADGLRPPSRRARTTTELHVENKGEEHHGQNAGSGL